MDKCPICGQQVQKNPCITKDGKCDSCNKELTHAMK